MPAPQVRSPAVAGRFYPSQVRELTRDLDDYLAGPEEAPIESAFGCVVPHAGYMYSGSVAGAVYRRLPPRSTYVILGPNHFGVGAPVAITSSGAWRTPLGEVPVDSELAQALRHACHLLMEDASAHSGEHSLEVQIPFLQRRVKDFSFVPIALAVSGYSALEAVGKGLAQALRTAQRPALVIASSDMNHYEPDAITRVKDRKAIERILALDPQGLYEVLRREDISMCGFGPAIALLTAAKELGAAKCELIRYATSADTSGDRSTVVGYAGIIVS
jgi:MEMO1 family protein